MDYFDLNELEDNLDSFWKIINWTLLYMMDFPSQNFKYWSIIMSCSFEIPLQYKILLTSNTLLVRLLY